MSKELNKVLQDMKSRIEALNLLRGLTTSEQVGQERAEIIQRRSQQRGVAEGHVTPEQRELLQNKLIIIKNWAISNPLSEHGKPNPPHNSGISDYYEYINNGLSTEEEMEGKYRYERDKEVVIETDDPSKIRYSTKDPEGFSQLNVNLHLDAINIHFAFSYADTFDIDIAFLNKQDGRIASSYMRFNKQISDMSDEEEAIISGALDYIINKYSIPIDNPPVDPIN